MSEMSDYRDEDRREVVRLEAEVLRLQAIIRKLEGAVICTDAVSTIRTEADSYLQLSRVSGNGDKGAITDTAANNGELGRG